MPEQLNGKQQLFVEAYLDCLNATESARRAGYAQPMQQGSRLLRNVEIRAAITAGLADRSLSADEVLARLSAIARSDIRDLLKFDTDGGWTGQLRIHQDAPLHLIKKLTPNRYGTAIELHDSQTALLTLARHHGLLSAIDWAKIPPEIVRALAEGTLNIDDLRLLATTSAD